MTAVLAAAVGLLGVGGLLMIIRGARRTATQPAPGRQTIGSAWARLTHRPAGNAGRRRDLLLLCGVLAGFAVAAWSGWLVAIVAIPTVALGVPYLLRLPKPRDVELLEALDRWVRSLAATLATGKSVTDAIRISRRTAPRTIGSEIGLLVARLNNRWETGEALRRFADDLDSADADGVVAALLLAANRGATGASETLHALADSIQTQLKGRRVIESERAKPYVVVRQVTVISIATLGLVFVLNPGYFEPYRTPLGQVILSVLVFLYLGALILLRRRARQRPRQRMLVRQSR
jgi:Flp pilus assembly protein TadB